MTIGRNDFAMLAPTGIPVSEVILRVCRRHWPDGVFQNAGSDEVCSLKDPWVWRIGVTSKEFFVFKSRELSESWDDSGPTNENCNHFLHFLIRKYSEEPGAVFEFTIVYDSMNNWMRAFVKELQDALFDVDVAADLQAFDPERLAA